ncbi:Siderophore iron transporter [Venturia nashicola]|nr:Siderophore iron transporter [Venturia nashicola]
MHFAKSAAFALMQSASVLAATKQVMVGPNGGLTFSPNTVTAAVGDTVQFMFVSQNHTVTSGNPNAGCTPNGLFNSGFVPAPGSAAAGAAAAAPAKAGKGKNNKMIRGENAIYLDPRAAALPSFSVQVKDTNPITVYCAQAQHCQVGMVMVINPSTTGATSLAAYQAKCAAAKANTPAKSVNGGALANLIKTPAAGTAKAGTNAAAAAPAAGTAKKAKKAKGKKAAGAGGAATAAAAAAAAAAKGN